ncbi:MULTISPECIES: eCIS core domain-containing protein [Streptomyces]|uniref:eCIS core domain-containing protein n=1 Tax=Streptomyces TaxID=1883 RepID=UPI001F45F0C3|nr:MULTISPECIES: DUF4157 domain-containing protein [unclassified Streptomyces]
MSKGAMVRAHEEATEQKAVRGGRPPHRPATAPTTGVSGAPMTPAAVMALQRSVGNHAVQRLIGQETHQHGAGCGHDGFDDKSPQGQVQLLNEAMATPSSPLGGSIRSEAESFYQTDLSPTRVHDNPVAQRATAALGAQAMTVGTHVFLGPQAAGRKDVIGHELGHVKENLAGVRETGNDNGAGLAVTDPVQGSERAAEADGAAFGAGRKIAPSVEARAAATDHADDTE